MKRLGLLLLVMGLAGGALATANAGTNATPRVICHRTSSATKPYVKLAVSARQLRAHLKHAADIIRTPLGACPKAVMTATAGGRAFNVALTVYEPGGKSTNIHGPYESVSTSGLP